MDSIYNQVCEIRERFPLRGAEAIRKSLQVTHGVCVPRYVQFSTVVIISSSFDSCFSTVVSRLLNIVEPEQVKERLRRALKWRCFWAAGVNDVWQQDQHDKWGRFGLWLH